MSYLIVLYISPKKKKETKMSIVTIQYITLYISYYVPYVILVIGNVGCLCNFITFTAKQLRRNSCGWYFLMSAVFDFCYINFGLFTKLSTEQYGSTLQNTNLAWCRLRVFLTWVLPCFSTGYLVLASIDRYLSTSTSTKLRSFSQLKIAYRTTCIPIILYTITTSHQFVFYDLRPTCSPLAGTYAYLLSLYSIVWTSFVPQGLMLIFGLLTYYNIHKSHQRLIQTKQQQSATNQPPRSRTDSQLITITLMQVLCSSVLLNIRSGYYAYTVLSTGLTKDSYRKAVESLILQISSFIFYFNFTKSFFINTLTSRLFRKVFKDRMYFIYYRRARIQPDLDHSNTQARTRTIRTN